MSQLDLIFAGSGAFGLPTLAALLEAQHRVTLVISQPDHPAGRGRKITPTPVAAWALNRGLKLLRSDDLNGESLPLADAMIVIAFGQKISAAAADRPRLGSMNLHASLLPRWRGAAPIHRAILAGDTQTGNSVIRLAERMDAGAILAQSRVAIGEIETAGELHDRLATDGAGLILQTLDRLADGTASPQEQDHAAATRAAKLSRPESRLDFSHPCAQLARQIRAMHPWPGCRVRLLDAAGDGLSRLTLVRARACDGEGERWGGGEIMLSGAVAAADGGVEILELQPESGRVMSLEEFRRGHRWTPGLRLESIQ